MEKGHVVLDHDTLRLDAWPWSKQPSVQPTANQHMTGYNYSVTIFQ